MYCIGLTGTIASGKSTVSHFFKQQGITVISADEASRELTALNQPALYAIRAHFGPSVINKYSGELERAKLREKIFQDPEERLWLEQLLHPLIRELIQTKIKDSAGPYLVIEIPLLYNRKDYPYLERVLLVQTTREKQIERILKRDHVTREQAELILATQKKLDKADDIVINQGSLAELEEKIAKLHVQYLEFASQ